MKAVLEDSQQMSDNKNLAKNSAGEEELEPMTPTHFDLAVAHMKLTDAVADAARRCLVSGQLQSDVSAETGMNRAQLSAAVRSIQKKFQEIMERNDWEKVEVVLPKQVAQGVHLTESYFVDPVLQARLARKKKRK